MSELTDARHVGTHINTPQHGLKFPYLTPPLFLLDAFVLWVDVTRCGPTTNLIKGQRCAFACGERETLRVLRV